MNNKYRRNLNLRVLDQRWVPIMYSNGDHIITSDGKYEIVTNICQPNWTTKISEFWEYALRDIDTDEIIMENKIFFHNGTFYENIPLHEPKEIRLFSHSKEQKENKEPSINLGVHQENINVIGFEKVMNKNTKYIYISGPVTDNLNYKENFQQATDTINKMNNNYIAINPMSIMVDDPDNYYSNMKICLLLLGLADGICMLPGWKKSKGVHFELGYAYGRKLDIFELKDGELIDVHKTIFGSPTS